MQPIDRDRLQGDLQAFVDGPVYLHLEVTMGAYTKGASGAFIRNGEIQVKTAEVAGQGPYRVGLRLPQGWVYAEGLTDWEVDAEGRLLIAGHDEEGRLSVALELARTPFPIS